MAIVTHERITRGGLEIGVSKLFSELYSDGDLTPQELARFSYAAWEAPECNAYGTTEINIGSEQGVAVSTQMSYFQAPIGGDDYVSKYVNGLIPSGRLYAFNVILYTSSNYEFITTDNAENVRLVTDIDLSTCAMTLRNAPSEDGTVSIDYPEARTIKKYTSNANAYNHGDDLLKHWDSDYNYWRKMGNIHPFCIIANDSGILFITHGSYFGAHEMTGFGSYASNLCPFNTLRLPYGDNIINQKWNYQPNCDITDFTKTKHLLRWVGNDQSYEPQTWASGTKKAAWDYDDNFYIVMEQTNQVYGIANDTYYIYPKTLNTVKRLIACVGLNVYIGDNKSSVIKPIIEGGLVVGYSEDASTPSEIDTITNVTGNNISPFPPGPGPTPGGNDDDIDSMGFDGMSCNVGGPAKYYIMSYSEIHHLIGDFNAHAEAGTTISNNIISCYVNALDWEWKTGSEPIEIYSGGAQTIAFTSDVNYAVLTGYNARNIIGSIDVPRMTNTFYDFSPYSTYEVYVPFCGWVALPDTVAGRHIKIYFETDEATCGCKGRVFFVDDSGNGVTVAEITGSFGAPCPVQVIEGGLYKQAMLSNGLQVIGGIASGVMGGASGSGVLAVGGLNAAMQSLGNCLIAGNTNYGQTIGRAGDASGLMCAGKPYLKITYPPIDEVVNNSIFGHTVGYLCNTVGKLSNFHGFTVSANPHVHINATSDEKEEITRLLEQGVILPYGK